MGAGRPTYLAVTSTGPTVSSPWIQTNWARTGKFDLSLVGVSTSGVAYQVDVTLDDPFSLSSAKSPAAYPPASMYPPLNPNAPTIFQSSMMSGVTSSGAPNGPFSPTWPSSNAAIGPIPYPITAYRLTVLGAGVVYLTALEVGIG